MSRNAKSIIVLFVFSTAIAALWGCESETTFSNNPPAGLTIEITKCTIAPGGTVTLVGAAEDIDADEISLRWTAEAGVFDPPDGRGASVDWTAPAEPGVYTVTLRASDGIDESSLSTEIDVAAPFPDKPTGVVTVSDEGRTYIITDLFPIEIGQATTLIIEAGVKIVVESETGGLDVRGTLRVNGTDDDPVSIGPSGCPGDDETWGGVYFVGAEARGEIAHMNVYNSQYGVTASDFAELAMDSSSVFGTDGNGISVSDQASAELRGVTVWDNGKGVVAINADVLLDACSIRYSGGPGVSLSGASVVTITNCLIASNDGNGIELVSDAAPVVHGCTFFFNGPAGGTGYDIRLLRPYGEVAAIDAENNYWAATDSVTIADRIFDNLDDGAIGARVDFIPWLDQEPLAATAERRGR